MKMRKKMMRSKTTKRMALTTTPKMTMTKVVVQKARKGVGLMRSMISSKRVLDCSVRTGTRYRSI